MLSDKERKKALIAIDGRLEVAEIDTYEETDNSSFLGNKWIVYSADYENPVNGVIACRNTEEEALDAAIQMLEEFGKWIMGDSNEENV